VKTGFGRRKEKIDPTTRELLYTRAYRQHHPGQPIELHFHNMSTGETFEIKLTERKEQSLYNALEEALASLDRNEFPPKPDPFVCPGCAFFLICPAQIYTFIRHVQQCEPTPAYSLSRHIACAASNPP